MRKSYFQQVEKDELLRDITWGKSKSLMVFTYALGKDARNTVNSPM